MPNPPDKIIAGTPAEKARVEKAGFMSERPNKLKGEPDMPAKFPFPPGTLVHGRSTKVTAKVPTEETQMISSPDTSGNYSIRDANKP